MDKYATIKDIKQLRKDLDDILQRVDSLKFNTSIFGPRELVHVKVVEAVMWLGICLKTLGETDPYPESYNPENPIIHPTADGLKF